MRMHPPEWNLDLAEETLAELEPYLLSSELFWPTDRRAPAGSPPFPRLTIGNLLLALDELSVQEGELATALRTRSQRVRAEWDRALAGRIVALERKAQREAEARRNLWRAYVADLVDKPDSAGSYANEVRNRVILARLGQTLGPARAIETSEQVQSVDAQLRSLFRRGSFVWDPELKRAYAPDGFWFLYGLPDPGLARNPAAEPKGYLA